MNRSMIRRARRRYLTMADAPLVADLAADLVTRRIAEGIKRAFSGSALRSLPRVEGEAGLELVSREVDDCGRRHPDACDIGAVIGEQDATLGLHLRKVDAKLGGTVA